MDNRMIIGTSLALASLAAAVTYASKSLRHHQCHEARNGIRLSKLQRPSEEEALLPSEEDKFIKLEIAQHSVH